jgi:hypothetical protein
LVYDTDPFCHRRIPLAYAVYTVGKGNAWDRDRRSRFSIDNGRVLSVAVEQTSCAANAIRAIRCWENLARMARFLTRGSALSGTTPTPATCDLAMVPIRRGASSRSASITVFAAGLGSATTEASWESVPKIIVRPLPRDRRRYYLVSPTNLSAPYTLPWLWNATDGLHGACGRAR